jgi:transposase
MKKNYFIGIDVSKSTLDVSICFENEKVYYKQIGNEPKVIKKWLNEVFKQFQISRQDCCVLIEYTGIYIFHLVNQMTEAGVELFVVPALAVKRSLGLVRGKNDRVDSWRLAQFAAEKHLTLVQHIPPRHVIVELSNMVSLRSRLLKAKQSLSVAAKEISKFTITKISKESYKLQNKSIVALENDIKKVDKQIKLLITGDPYLNKIYKQIISIDGVGPITAVNVIITTNEFKDITEAKKFACYAGIAPFEHSSGSSIRGRDRVSHLANKKMKHILHMAAMSAIQIKGDLKNFFDRKVNEGKNKMSVLNAIRNKIVLRIFAVVNQDKFYQKSLV